MEFSNLCTESSHLLKIREMWPVARNVCKLCKVFRNSFYYEEMQYECTDVDEYLTNYISRLEEVLPCLSLSLNSRVNNSSIYFCNEFQYDFCFFIFCVKTF